MGFPDSAAAHCKVEVVLKDVTFLWPNSSTNISALRPSQRFVSVVPPLAEEAADKLGLKSDFISAPLTDWYRFTCRYRYIEDVLAVKLSFSGDCGDK